MALTKIDLSMIESNYNASNGLVLLDSVGKLPVLDGGQLTNINLTNNSIDSTKLSNSGTMPAWNGSQLTNVNAVQLNGKTVGTNADNIISLDNSGNLPSLNGQNLQNLNANNITTGVLNPSRMGTGTANSSTVLLGNGTWGSPPSSGGINNVTVSPSGNGYVNSISASITSNVLNISYSRACDCTACCC